MLPTVADRLPDHLSFAAATWIPQANAADFGVCAAKLSGRVLVVHIPERGRHAQRPYQCTNMLPLTVWKPPGWGVVGVLRELLGDLDRLKKGWPHRELENI